MKTDKKDFIKSDITDEDVERAKGAVFQASLKAKQKYVNKSDEELLKIWKSQVWMHNFASVSGYDDVEYYTAEGILFERGFTKQKLQKIYDEIIKEGKEWRNLHHTINEIFEVEGGTSGKRKYEYRRIE